MKLLALNQMVGNGTGYTLVRDLFEQPNGSRVSVHKSAWHEEKKSLKGKSAEDRIKLFPPEGGAE